MFNNFSAEANASINAAKAEAQRHNQPSLALPHLLIGILRIQADLLPGFAAEQAAPEASPETGDVPAEAALQTPLDRFIGRLGQDLHGGGEQYSGQIKATTSAVVAVKRADALMLERHDNKVLPLHLLVATLEGATGAHPAEEQVPDLGIDLARWLADARERLADLPQQLPVAPTPAATPQIATPNLDKFGRDLTALAREGKLQPIIGREREIRQMIEVLCKINKNNPALVGEPGVGKTAIVEGLALRMATGTIPFQLRSRRLIALDLNSMVAGTRYRGDFEERLKGVLDEAQKSRAILFIDELHTMIGTGDSEGGGDLSNVLKPYLARGDISVIGATTIVEYRRYIERDGALERRFQPLNIDEPSTEATLHILRTLRPRFEEHYHATISDEVLEQVMEYGARYLRNRYFPDKALDLLQLACARAQLDSLPDTPIPEGEEPPLIHVDEAQLLSVVSELTGIPLDRFEASEELAGRFLNMESILGQRVFGQPEALAAVSNALRLAKRQLDINPLRPDGVFMFLGPVGVGKSELGKALADFLFGDESRIISLDMTEFSEPHSVSRIIGSPPGYVGFDEGGQMTEKVRTRPFSLLLLDEIEKAHPSVLNLFLQVFDEGKLTDARGRTVYFSDVTVVMTSNVGAERLTGRAIGFHPETLSDDAEAEKPFKREAVLSEARKHFPTELLSRVDEIVLFRPISRDAARRITQDRLDGTVRKLFARQGIELTTSPDVVDFVVTRGFSMELGARNLQRTIEEQVLGPLARRTYMSDWKSIVRVNITVQDGELHFEALTADLAAAAPVDAAALLASKSDVSVPADNNQS